MTADNVEYLPARRVSDGKFVLKPVRVDGCGFARLQDTHADQRCGVIQTDCQKAARVRVIEDDGQVAGRAAFCGRADTQRNSFRRRAGELGQGCVEVHCFMGLYSRDDKTPLHALFRLRSTQAWKLILFGMKIRIFE